GKIGVCTETTNIGSKTSCIIGCIDTGIIVIADQTIICVQIVHTVCDAVTKDITERVPTAAAIDPIAVLVVSDLIGKRDVVAVSRPGISRVLTRGGERRMEVDRLGRAGGRTRLIEQLGKPVAGAGNHRALFAGRQVVDCYLQSIRGVREIDAPELKKSVWLSSGAKPT